MSAECNLQERLAMLRKCYGLTQQQLAEKLNMSTCGYGKYEYGLSDPPTYILRSLGEIYGMSLAELLDPNVVPEVKEPEQKYIGPRIIDFAKKGNVVRFFIGGSTEYWGDDWNDMPYDCNAGKVYDEYVTGYRDVYFPYDWMVLEPCDGETNCDYSKEDMKKRKVPCIIALPPDEDRDWWRDDNFARNLGDERAVKYYFGDPMLPTKLKEEDKK